MYCSVRAGTCHTKIGFQIATAGENALTAVRFVPQIRAAIEARHRADVTATLVTDVGLLVFGRGLRHGWYLSADSRLGANVAAEDQPWHTSLRLGHAEKRVNNHEWFLATALTYDLPRRAGREQSLGVGASWVRTSSAFRGFTASAA